MAKKKVLKTPIPEITDSSPTQLYEGGFFRFFISFLRLLIIEYPLLILLK